jgi:FkbM family methyltransferase
VIAPRLSTAAKVRVARALRSVILAGRALAGRTDRLVRCRRGGLTWELELDEGIQLSIYALGAFERSTGAVLRRLAMPGAQVIDIGANVGAHALPLARQVGPSGRVIAVEPTDHAFARLSRNLALNAGLETTLKPVQAALVAPGADAPSRIFASWPLDPSDQEHPVHKGRRHAARGTAAMTLDALVEAERLPRIDLIKMDVDGHEVGVLAGGTESLSRWRPPIVLELSPHQLRDAGASLAALVSALRCLGYVLTDTRRRPLPLDPAALDRLIPAGGSINAIAVAAGAYA